MKRQARCACGGFRVDTVGEPDRVLACNCRECQRRTGSVFGVAGYFPEAQVIGVVGESRDFTRTSGAVTFVMSFCPRCGTSVLWRSSALPEHVAIAVGCFADPCFPQPTEVAWVAEHHPWVRFPDEAAKYEGSAFG